jgi:hypothetical protein
VIATRRIDGHHRLSRARTAVDDQHALFSGPSRPHQMQRALEHELLLVDHHELAIALHERCKAVRQ